MGIFRDYYGRASRRFGSFDMMTRLIIVGALVLIIVNILPRLPGAGQGVTCANLPVPGNDGSGQSIYASRVDPSVLTIELVAEDASINVGEALVLWVRLYNSSMAPLTLFMMPDEAVLRYTGQEPGLVFSVRGTNGTVLGEPFNVRALVPNRQRFTPSELRVLGPRSFCNIRLTLDANRLRAARLTQGQYVIQAVYRNQSRGALVAVSAQTPTPVFDTQGVWVGEILSAAVQISIGIAPQ